MKALSRAAALVAYAFLLYGGSSGLTWSQESEVVDTLTQPDPVLFPRRVDARFSVADVEYQLIRNSSQS